MTSATRVTEEFSGEGKDFLEILSSPWNAEKAMLLVEGYYCKQKNLNFDQIYEFVTTCIGGLHV